MLHDFFEYATLESASSLSFFTVEIDYTWTTNSFDFPSKNSPYHLGNAITQNKPYLPNDILGCTHGSTLLSWTFTYPSHWISTWIPINNHMKIHIDTYHLRCGTMLSPSVHFKNPYKSQTSHVALNVFASRNRAHSTRLPSHIVVKLIA